MNDSLVIVDIGLTDSRTESIQPMQVTARNIWTFRMPMTGTELLEKTISQLNPRVLDHATTVISCSSADDTHARYRSVINDRARPRDVLAALGVNITMVLDQHLPKLQQTFKVDAACASGLVALELAGMYTQSRPGIVLLTGVDISTAPIFLNLFYYIGAVACAPNMYYSPFDQRRAGFAMGEGAAIIAVTTASYAKQIGLTPIATVDSVANQTIVTHPTSPTAPDLMQTFVEQVIATSQQPRARFAYWDAHATATPNGDEMEYQVFSRIFSGCDAAISSYKSAVGHCMAASGLIEIANAIKHLQKQQISHNHNLEQPIADDERLISAPTSTQKKTFVKTSFGFGGRNGAAVITVE